MAVRNRGIRPPTHNPTKEKHTMASSAFESSIHPLPGAEVEKQLDSAANSAHGAVDKALAAADEAAKSVQPFISRTAQTAHQKVDEVAAAVKPAASWVAEKNHAIATASRNAEADAREYISTHPWQSLLGGVALGYLLGRLASRH
jgi:ElaB/YqjD/DUF883 family membrane-anchored ribosome-binding protein